jgi:hypothetical protein
MEESTSGSGRGRFRCLLWRWGLITVQMACGAVSRETATDSADGRLSRSFADTNDRVMRLADSLLDRGLRQEAG